MENGSNSIVPFDSFQGRATHWASECFGPDNLKNVEERRHRFMEEAIELFQSVGGTEDEVKVLGEYVFNRPVGEPSQETGGVMITLAILCYIHNINTELAAETELVRCHNRIVQIREKQKSKPSGSIIPIPSSQKPVPTVSTEIRELQQSLSLQKSITRAKDASAAWAGGEVIRLSEIIDSAPHTSDCASLNVLRQPMPTFTEATCKRMTAVPGCCPKCDWLNKPENSPRAGKCDCWKSKAILTPEPNP